MNLLVSAAFQPDAQEVWIDFRSTADDMTTPTLADSVELDLKIEATDPIGTKSYISIGKVSFTNEYVLAEKNFVAIFRNPPRTMDLFVEATAKYGSNTFTKRVAAGISADPRTDMELPDNVLNERDPFDSPETGGPNDEGPTHNTVILAPELRDQIRIYDFTVANAVEEYDGLVYMGGGNRLLVNNETNQFEAQTVDESYWTLGAFAFLEPAATNILTNPWFLNVTADAPVGYALDSAGALVTQTTDFDHSVTSAAKIWSLRFRQTNVVSAFNQIEIQAAATVNVTTGLTYTFSAYARVRNMTGMSDANNLILALRWFNGTTFISESSQILQTSNYRNMDMAMMTATAPAGATKVRPVIRLASIDSGDDVELQLLAVQVELGNVPSTRVNGSRLADDIVIDPYDPVSHKIRFQFIPGFASGVANHVLTTGPLSVTFKANGDVEANLTGHGILATPLTFAAGDMVDLTVSHQSGKKLSIYRDGILLADTPLPTFTASPSPLVIQGIGVELLKLSVFSRQGA